jgi:hypothetical protein
MLQLVIPDDLKPIGFAQGGNRAGITIHEQFTQLGFAGQPEFAVQLFAHPTKVQAVIGGKHTDDITIVIFQNNGLGHLVRGNMSGFG